MNVLATQVLPTGLLGENGALFAVLLEGAAKSMSSCIVFTFWTLTSVVVFLFEIMNKRLEEIAACHEIESEEQNYEMKIWEKQHAILRKLVDNLNELFGPIVMSFVFYGFGTFMIHFNLALREFRNIVCLFYLMVAIHKFVYLLLLIVASGNLQDEVI